MASNQPSRAPAPILKNSPAAPFVYFDGAPAFGANAGMIEIELAARSFIPKPDNSGVNVDMVCVAHLRSSVAAMLNLRDAIDKAIAIATGNNGDKPN